MEKKAWKKPQLIVLSRGRSEENVLFSCKGEGGFGADITQGGCYSAFPILCDFYNCEQPATS
jgi:hypothetical protein